MKKLLALALLVTLTACQTWPWESAPKGRKGASTSSQKYDATETPDGAEELDAYIMRTVGENLTSADIEAYKPVAQTALEKNKTGKTSTWNSVDTGNSGTITPKRTFKNDEGAYCREFTQTVTISGTTSRGFGTACRYSGQGWKAVAQ